MRLQFCWVLRVWSHCFVTLTRRPTMKRDIVAFVREHIWHKASLMGYSMRQTHSCLRFEWLSVGYGFIWRSFSLFVRVCFTIVCFIPHWYLICFSLCVCVCVCVMEGFWISLTVTFPLCVCECVLGIFCECMLGSSVWNLLVTFSLIVLSVYIYIYIYT